VILNLCVSNLILIGDHLQLQPFTSVNDPDNTAATATHTRSLLERAVLVCYTGTALYMLLVSICMLGQRTSTLSSALYCAGHTLGTEHTRLQQLDLSVVRGSC
jgi:hypothetical protein